MPENKTQPSDLSVDDYIAGLSEKRQGEARILRDLMARVTGWPPTMWGATMVGFGAYHYVYDSGHEGDTFVVGFSARKTAVSLYGIFSAYALGQDNDLWSRLGPHTTGKGCVWVKKLEDIDLSVLESLVQRAVSRHAS